MKTALVIGASRGMGRQIALEFAKNGYNVGVAAKSSDEAAHRRPGTVQSVADEITKLGGKAIPIVCNATKEEDINKAVQTCLQNFGSIDVLIYNAALAIWTEVLQTPLQGYDMMSDVGARGAFCAVQAVAPHMLKQNSGRIILISPPIYNRFFNGKTAFAMSKIGMSVLTYGFSNEIKDTGVSISSLWPSTVIEGHSTSSVPKRILRKPDIMAHACWAIANADAKSVNGQTLIDEDFLRSQGQEDFTVYRADPDNEPPRTMPREFPDLRVKEQNQTTPGMPKHHP